MRCEMKKLLLLLLLITDCYAQLFTESNSGVTVSLNSVSFAGSFPIATTWISGDSGVILKSTNGTLWTNVRSLPIPSTLSLNNICAFDINNILVTGSDLDSAYIFMSSNSGTNWIKVLAQSNGYFYSIGKTSTTNGLAVGKPLNGRWSLWKTTNKGFTWDSTNLYLQQAGNELSWSNALFCEQSNNFVWFGTNNSRIYRGQNFSNWLVEQIGQQNSFAIWFTGTLGWMGGNSLMYTTNSGNNWIASPSNPPGSNDVTSVYYGPIGIFVTRLSNQIYRSTNNGSTWTIAYTASSGNYRHSCYFSTFGGGLIFVRSNGRITISNFPDAVKLLSSRIPEQFSLSQNYPNPFNPRTKIRFSLPNPSEGGAPALTLIIYDALGREVETLINEQLNAGTYEADWNAEKYSSGIYYYKLFTDGFGETKKMILIK